MGKEHQFLCISPGAHQMTSESSGHVENQFNFWSPEKQRDTMQIHLQKLGQHDFRCEPTDSTAETCMTDPKLMVKKANQSAIFVQHEAFYKQSLSTGPPWSWLSLTYTEQPSNNPCTNSLSDFLIFLSQVLFRNMFVPRSPSQLPETTTVTRTKIQPPSKFKLMLEALFGSPGTQNHVIIFPLWQSDSLATLMSGLQPGNIMGSLSCGPDKGEMFIFRLHLEQ